MIHLHHSHVTGKILGYAHDFCNEKFRENKDIFSCVAHTFFGFDVYFLLKGIRVSVWDTKDINIGGSGLTTVNFGSIGEVKLIDRMKCFLTSLERLAATLDPIERERIEKLTVQFLTTHSYFSKVWKELTDNQKKIVLEIIVNGKGVIPYKKVESIHSLSIVPEDGIFYSRDEFFSMLKGSAVGEESYENAKKLFILLRMRNLSDLIDLYNVQDVILPLEMMENRFQSIQKKSGYNPRIINLARSLAVVYRENNLR